MSLLVRFRLLFPVLLLLSTVGAVGATRADSLPDSTRTAWKWGIEIEAGGLAKAGFFPPVFWVERRHYGRELEFAYGLSGGAHVLFITSCYNARFYGATTYKNLTLEASAGRYWYPALAADDMNPINDLITQTLANIKFGVRAQRMRLRVGTSFVLTERVSLGDEGKGLLDFGEIGGRIYSLGLVIGMGE